MYVIKDTSNAQFSTGCRISSLAVEFAIYRRITVLPQNSLPVNMFSYSLVLLSIGTLDSPPLNLPPPEFIGIATTRQIYHGAPACHPDLTAASRKSDGGVAEGSIEQR